MPDEIFDNPRLAAIYDAFDGQRTDLDYYVAIVKELRAKSILDVGCGTGCLASLLSEHGLEVIGVDPAKASLDLARSKPYANQVNWILGDATMLPVLAVDMAIMTGNVAQVFLTDEVWMQTLSSIYRSLKPEGHLVFEVRDPAKQAWLKWTKEQTYQQQVLPALGAIECWCDVTHVSDESVSFCYTYIFESDGSIVHSNSTLRFRQKDEIVSSLEQAGYLVKGIRDAPDRPAQEWVFVAQREN
jgi:ubiquinone/menaquinone biosynthesis C-methylase UbiE